MDYAIAVIGSLGLGAAIAYAFRGWIEREKAKEKAALQQSAAKVIGKL